MAAACICALPSFFSSRAIRASSDEGSTQRPRRKKANAAPKNTESLSGESKSGQSVPKSGKKLASDESSDKSRPSDESPAKSGSRVRSKKKIQGSEGSVEAKSKSSISKKKKDNAEYLGNLEASKDKQELLDVTSDTDQVEKGVEEDAERRKKLFPKFETLWKKPFPWLGREFEETFVKPRNEPNPLVCCFGEVMSEFIPSVRVCVKQMDPDAYSSWKGLQWIPPEFARSPGTTPSNVAISIVRLKGKSAFIGKVGDDELGKSLIKTLKDNDVETKGVKVDRLLNTSCFRGKLVKHGKRKMSMSSSQLSAEANLDISEVDMDILKESKLFHFSSLSLTTEKMRSTVISAIEAARGFGNVIFFDVNLPLPFWITRDDTWQAIEKAWTNSDVIKINKVELEYLIEDEGLAVRMIDRDTMADTPEELYAKQDPRFEYHYTPEQIAPIWRDNIKILFVTDGTYRIHYYTPKFHGDVVGTEDVLVAAFSCDRTGSGDTISAAMIRKLTAQPDIFEDQDRLEKALRFAIAAAVISQWTIGAIRGFPTESAAQNLTEQMFPLTQI